MFGRAALRLMRIAFGLKLLTLLLYIVIESR
jgi:hypothetical protein